MRRFIPYIACGLLLVSGWACTRTDDMDIPSVNQDKIVIKTSLDPHVVTRAADVEAERKITRIDVFVVEGDGDISLHETHDTQNNFDAADGNGTLALKKARKDFPVNESYNVYLLANATADIESDLDDAETLDELKAIVQEAFTVTKSTNEVTNEESETKHTLLHLSGTTSHPNDPTKQPPQTFMMDAVATTSSSTSKAVVLNDGVTTNNTSLVAEFKRAAAKIVVNIKQGESVQFERYLLEETVNEGSAEYVFYNLPTETPILADAEALLSDNNTLIETDPIVLPRTASTDETIPDDFPTFTWKDNVGSVNADGTGVVKIQIVGYAYAHNWENKPTLNFEPSLLLCLPMYWDANKDKSDGKETMRPGNWYKVPLSQEKKFERNTCYEVNITINAVGAESKSEAIELDDIDYDTRPWEVTTIEIGDDTTTPQYLKLNTDLVKMYNTNLDTSSLTFSSSSPITSIVLADVYTHNVNGTFVQATQNSDGTYQVGNGDYAYYLNKYNQTKSLTTVDEFEGESNLRSKVFAAAEQNKLSGKITITSPFGPNEAEINAEIAKLDKPVIPTQPTIPAGKNWSITTEPVPANYIKPLEYTLSDNGWRNSGNSYTTQTQTVSATEYRYNDGKFQKRTGNITFTRTGSYSYGGVTWGEPVAGSMANNVKWEDDEVTQQLYNNDVKLYQDFLSDPDAQEYIAEWTTYQTKLAEYNVLYEQYIEDVAEIRASFDIPETHFNTVRYLEFLVTNQEGLQATFRVEQYPTIYIQNIVGWYSYRDDFYTTAGEKPTTILYKGDGIVSITYKSGSGNNINYDKNTTLGNSYFWGSKINHNPDNTVVGSNGFSITYYRWDGNTLNDSAGSSGGGNNARMYHVRVTSSSSQYTVGRPLLVKDYVNREPTDDPEIGITDNSEANAKLVSPSFMIASQLGAVQSAPSNFDVAVEHCKNYVEVAYDGTIYNDWRLPTAAEIQIIAGMQAPANSSSGDAYAIDRVLIAKEYYTPTGLITVTGNTSMTAVRCVRDAYDDNTPNN